MPGMRRPPRWWQVAVVLVLLVPAFAAASTLYPLGEVQYRDGGVYGVAGPGERMSARGVSVRWHSARVVRPAVLDVGPQVPLNTASVVVAFDVAVSADRAPAEIDCIVRVIDDTGRIWTHSIGTAGARRLGLGAEQPGNQNCLEAAEHGMDAGTWYPVEVHLIVANDVAQPLTVDIRDGYVPGPRRFFRFRY